MNLQSLIVVILRLMTLNFFLEVAVNLSPQLLRLAEPSKQGGFTGMRQYLDFPVVMLIGFTLVAVLIWIL
jgi:hypothetical protein